MRLDQYLAEEGLAKSRSFAKTLIEDGYVTVNGKIVKKPSADVPEGCDVAVSGLPYEYVSRGGVKLEAALDAFKVDAAGKICVDIGASTGGFTDCLLRRGAVKVFAVDSGSGQLVKEISEDPRVVNMENFNARYLKPDDIGCLCDIAVTDVSFISQTLIHPSVRSILNNDGTFVSLIKPQFECGRNSLGKSGIVRDRSVLYESVSGVIRSAEKYSLGCTGLIKSPVTGGDGNTEFLMVCRPDVPCTVTDDMIKEICYN